MTTEAQPLILHGKAGDIEQYACRWLGISTAAIGYRKGRRPAFTRTTTP